MTKGGVEEKREREGGGLGFWVGLFSKFHELCLCQYSSMPVIE